MKNIYSDDREAMSELRRTPSEGSGVIMNPFKSPLGLFVFGVKIGKK